MVFYGYNANYLIRSKIVQYVGLYPLHQGFKIGNFFENGGGPQPLLVTWGK